MRKPCIGDKIKVFGIPQFQNVELTIKSIFLGTIFARPKFGREDIEIQDGNFEYLEPIKLTGVEKTQLVKRLVKSEYLPHIKAVQNEIAVFNRLFSKYPDDEFWKTFDPGFQTKSLLWWAGSGADDLRKHFNEYSLSKKDLTKEAQPITLREDKIGEDVEVNIKPKKLTDIWK